MGLLVRAWWEPASAAAMGRSRCRGGGGCGPRRSSVSPPCGAWRCCCCGCLRGGSCCASPRSGWCGRCCGGEPCGRGGGCRAPGGCWAGRGCVRPGGGGCCPGGAGRCSCGPGGAGRCPCGPSGVGRWGGCGGRLRGEPRCGACWSSCTEPPVVVSSCLGPRWRARAMTNVLHGQHFAPAVCRYRTDLR
ncbi:MAG: hypothetical protein GEU97_12740 [Actinophytocola sp.]|nr:hypothetical protein [Actinophytocola sp.]